MDAATRSAVHPVVDSGYASTASSNQESPAKFAEEFRVVEKLPFFRKKTITLYAFNGPISKRVLESFEDLQELLNEQLVDYITCGGKRTVGSILWRLKTLGERREDAVPWIVVCCKQDAAKRVRRFFDLPEIKARCQPTYTEEDTVGFKVYVLPVAPRLLDGTDLGTVFEAGTHHSIYGIPIWTHGTGQCHRARLGGLVSVTRHGGPTYSIFGLTAGHISGNCEELDTDASAVPSDSDYDSNDGTDSTQCFKLAGLPKTEELSSPADQDKSRSQSHIHQLPWADPANGRHLKFGPIIATSQQANDLCSSATDQNRWPNLDWALVDTTGWKTRSPTSTEFLRAATTNGNDSLFAHDAQFPVKFLGLPGTHASLSTVPSYIVVPPAKRATRVFSLSVTKGQGKPSPHHLRPVLRLMFNQHWFMVTVACG